MHLTKTSAFAGLIASSAIALSVAPAQAFTLNPDGSIYFDKAETIDFSFIESRGFYSSEFGIYNANKGILETLFQEKTPKGYDQGSSDAKNDWLGTCGETVKECSKSYTFAAGNTYLFGLFTPGNVGQNPQGGSKTFTESTGVFQAGSDLAAPEIDSKNIGKPPAFTSTANFYRRTTVGPTAAAAAAAATKAPKGSKEYNEAYKAALKFQDIDMSSYDFFIAINDSYAGDKDVNDFIIGAKGAKSVPEPASLAGLGMVAAAIGLGRRRQGGKV